MTRPLSRQEVEAAGLDAEPRHDQSDLQRKDEACPKFVGWSSFKGRWHVYRRSFSIWTMLSQTPLRSSSCGFSETRSQRGLDAGETSETRPGQWLGLHSSALGGRSVISCDVPYEPSLTANALAQEEQLIREAAPENANKPRSWFLFTPHRCIDNSEPINTCAHPFGITPRLWEESPHSIDVI
jgi:hypothetical protein